MDIGLRLAPVGSDGPDFNALKYAFEDAVRNNQPYIDQCRLNYETRYAIWNGHSRLTARSTTAKAAACAPRRGMARPTCVVFLVDNIINKKVAMQCMAVKRANLSAVPVEGNDLGRANDVSNFMRWLINTQIPEVDREMELCANYLNEKASPSWEPSGRSAKERPW
jgi:hypothetical protein